MITKHNIKDFTGGWIVGNFDPSLFKTSTEVCIKSFSDLKKIDYIHFHKKTTEINIVLDGNIAVYEYNLNKELVEINDFHDGEIFVVEPYTPTRVVPIFKQGNLVVIKTCSDKNDKYIL